MNLYFLFPTTPAHFLIYAIFIVVVVFILKKFNVIEFKKDCKEGKNNDI